MSINVMSTVYYPTGYVNNKTAKAESGKSFAEIASQKVVEADKEKVQEKPSKVLDLIGTHAPDEVKQAWQKQKKKWVVGLQQAVLGYLPTGNIPI